MVRAILLCGMLLFPCAEVQADELALLAGHGQGTSVFGDAGEDIGQWAIVVQGARPLSDRLDLLTEAQFQLTYQPGPGRFGAVVLGLRYNLGEALGARPYVSAGAGVGYLGAVGLRQRNGFNFALQAAAGARFGDHWLAEVRFHHISNADLREPNPGLNAVQFLVGPRWEW